MSLTVVPDYVRDILKPLKPEIYDVVAPDVHKTQHSRSIPGLVPPPRRVIKDPQSSLTVLAQGMGLEYVLYHLLRLYNDRHSLVFVLNLQSDLLDLLNETFLSENLPQIRNVTASTKDTLRREMYLQGGIISVTHRILMTDFLTQLIPMEVITGIIILNAHDIREGMEEFLVRKYAEQSGGAKPKQGFVLAFTDQPARIPQGLNRLETLMQRLRLKQLWLWPRFHLAVKQYFDRAQNVVAVDALGGFGLVQQEQNNSSAVDPASNSPPALEPNSQSPSASQGLPNGGLMVEQVVVGPTKLMHEIYVRLSDVVETLERKIAQQGQFAYGPAGGGARRGRPQSQQRQPSTFTMNEIQEVRELMRDLFVVDCFDFFRYLCNIKSEAEERERLGTTASERSWMLSTDIGDEILRLARSRIYKVRYPKESVTPSEPPTKKVKQGIYAVATPAATPKTPTDSTQLPYIEEVLEENPRWANMLSCIHKVKEDLQAKLELGASLDSPTDTRANRVLVICDSFSQVSQFRNFIVPRNASWYDPYYQHVVSNNPGQPRSYMLHTKWLSFLRSRPKREDYATRRDEDSTLQRHYERIEAEEAQYFTLLAADPAVLADVQLANDTAIARDYPDVEVVDLHATTTQFLKSGMSVFSLEQPLRHPLLCVEGSTLLSDTPIGRDCGKITVFITSISTFLNSSLLYTIRPAHVFVASSSRGVLPLIRKLELYHATLRQQGDFKSPVNVNVKFFSYTAERDSTEAAEHEIAAFDLLIEKKRDLVLTETETALPSDLPRPETTRQRNALLSEQLGLGAGEVLGGGLHRILDETLARHASGSLSDPNAPVEVVLQGAQQGLLTDASRLPHVRILVDLREFRTPLINALDLAHFKLIPSTLVRGDFLLSPNIVIERKALHDLEQSLRSGRLKRQMEQLLRHGRAPPILLIELLHARVNPDGIPAKPTEKQLQTLLTVFMIHFPTVRILWSVSQEHTVRYFIALKAKEPDPDITDAGVIIPAGATDMIEGVEGKADGPEDEAENDDEEDDETDYAPADVLLKLPGVNHANAKQLISKFSCLAELCRADLRTLQNIIGESAGSELHRFLHKTGDYPPSFG